MRSLPVKLSLCRQRTFFTNPQKIPEISASCHRIYYGLALYGKGIPEPGYIMIIDARDQLYSLE
jgi:hypothetical protein